MGTVDLSEFEKKIIPECAILFSAGIWRNTRTLSQIFDTKEKLRDFITEIETHIHNPSMMKIAWNGQVFDFGGAKFGYVGYFKSDIHDAVVKLCFRIQPDSREVTIGIISVATKKEEHKYNSHISNMQ